MKWNKRYVLRYFAAWALATASVVPCAFAVVRLPETFPRDYLGRDTGYTLCALPEGGRVALVATAPDSSVTYANGPEVANGSGGAGGSPAEALSSVTYAYDHLGRLSGVVADIGGAPRVFVYTRAPGTDLVTGYMTDGFSRWVSYEPQRSLVSAVSNFFGSARISTFGYANDAAGRRTAITRGGAAMGALAGASDAYGYDERSQVVSARRTIGEDPVSGFAFDYAYDPIGNRVSATEYDESGAPLFAEYAANELNQYTRRTVPGYAAVRGEADTNAFVTVNERPVSRTGVFFHGGDYADNTLSNLYADLEIYAAINPPGTNVPDTVYSVTTSVFVAKTPETFTYDADGNMTFDGRFTYTWNADNRMVMASNDAVVVTYAYDHRGRMVRKEISRRAAEPQRMEYTWDDWNIILETTSNLSTFQPFNLSTSSYVWGLDLDGTLQGAGGVGGLLAVVRDDGVFLPAYDANGNITEYVTTNGEVVAHYDYSPFGETLIFSGPLASTFTHRFSTKPWCADTELIEYQMRKYRPEIGRWMSRDPIGERGGMNLLAIAINSAVNCLDKYGLNVTNNSLYPVVVKPEDDEDDPVVLLPGESYLGSQDGVYLCIPNECLVFKTANNIDVEITSDNQFKTSGGSLIERAVQKCNGGCKDDEFLNKWPNWPSKDRVRELCEEAIENAKEEYDSTDDDVQDIIPVNLQLLIR